MPGEAGGHVERRFDMTSPTERLRYAHHLLRIGKSPLQHMAQEHRHILSLALEYPWARLSAFLAFRWEEEVIFGMAKSIITLRWSEYPIQDRIFVGFKHINSMVSRFHVQEQTVRMRKWGLTAQHCTVEDVRAANGIDAVDPIPERPLKITVATCHRCRSVQGRTRPGGDVLCYGCYHERAI